MQLLQNMPQAMFSFKVSRSYWGPGCWSSQSSPENSVTNIKKTKVTEMIKSTNDDQGDKVVKKTKFKSILQ